MDARTLDYLTSHGVLEPVCENCLSEDFTDFVIFQNKVMWCTFCSPMFGKFRHTSNHKEDLISTADKPNIEIQPEEIQP